MLRLALLFRPGIVITNVPYQVALSEEDETTAHPSPRGTPGRNGER
jgi:hypothetical protein